MSWQSALALRLRTEEGVRYRPYRDTVGKLTAGVGRNLDDVPFSDDEVNLMLENDVARAETLAECLVPSFDSLTDNRKLVLTDMAFNMGNGLGGFRTMLACVAAQNWDGAADAMLASQWATQVGQRAQSLASLMREG